MRPPPAIELKSVASARARRADLLLHVLTAAVAGAWLGGHAGAAVPAQVVCALVPALLAGGALVRSQRRVAWQQHTLAWDGSGWRHAVDAHPAQPVEVRLMVDLGDCIVLRLRPASGEPRDDAPMRWLALEARDVGPGFRALCATLHGARPGHLQTTGALS